MKLPTGDLFSVYPYFWLLLVLFPLLIFFACLAYRYKRIIDRTLDAVRGLRNELIDKKAKNLVLFMDCIEKILMGK